MTTGRSGRSNGIAVAPPLNQNVIGAVGNESLVTDGTTHVKPALGLASRTVTLVPYDLRWPQHFERVRHELRTLGRDVLAVHHVGSTAVPGLCAKPLFNVLVSVADLELARTLIPQLERLGYEFRPNHDLEDRLFFRRRAGGLRTHHLSLSEPSSPHHVATLAFRDALRADAKLARSYAELKMRLARRFPNDRESYILGKTEFVLEVLAKANVRAPVTGERTT